MQKLKLRKGDSSFVRRERRFLLLAPLSRWLNVPRDWRTWALCFLVYVVLGGLWSLALDNDFDVVAHPDALSLRFQELGVFPFAGGVMASLAGAWRDGWVGWLLRWIWSTVYALLFLLFFLLGGVGVILPFAEPARLFGHGLATGVLWILAGIPLGLLVMAVGGVAWVRAGTAEGGVLRAALRVSDRPLEWAVRSAAALVAITGSAALFNLLDARVGPLPTMLTNLEFVWVPLVWVLLTPG
ncbi:MAG: hypothetical protein QJR08_00120 [Bacillota bacterium]|nr:hypothetical protein [Bacillota bacterium]